MTPPVKIKRILIFKRFTRVGPRQNIFSRAHVGGDNVPKKTKHELLREQIKRDLLDQLERNNTIGTYYTDMVDDYMKLWDTKNRLIADIEERGVAIKNITNAGINFKRNDSVGDLIKTNAQMLKLLDSLGIRPAQTDGDEDAEM